MSKGFTIKANAPTPKKTEGEFDIAAAREQVRGKSIIFCLPGRGVSYTFLKNFVQLCFDLVKAVQAFKFHRIILPWSTLHDAK